MFIAREVTRVEMQAPAAACGHVLVVSHEYERRPRGLVEFEDQVRDLVPRVRVEVACGFIGKQHRR